MQSIISRKQAKAEGLRTYFTGKPCLRGMVAERITANGKCQCDLCVANHLGNRKKYRQENDQIIKESKRAHRIDNAEEYRLRDRLSRERRADKVKEYRKQYYAKNRDLLLELKRSKRADNPESHNQRTREWRAANPEKIKAYKDASQAKIRADSSKRRAARRDRIPAWFGELDQFVLEEAYDIAKEREEATGIGWHVDHMIPMQARKVSGLHCAANIQVIPAVMNLEKHNKMRLTKPLEWLK